MMFCQPTCLVIYFILLFVGAARRALVSKALTAYPGYKCGYGKEDVLDRTARDIEFWDPRAKFKDFEVPRGFASALLRLGRTMLNTRAVALELTGEQAKALIYAQYGIVRAQVPESCFAKLRPLLDNSGREWKEIRSRRPELLRILKELPDGCASNSSDSQRSQGKLAKKILKALQNGYWSSYEPVMNDQKFIIGARVLDYIRWQRGTVDRVRQIWHYGKLHILLHTEPALRENMQRATSERERQRLEAQMWQIITLESMRYARIEFVELDGLQNCISARPHDVEHIIRTIHQHPRAKFRVTIMFRERYWQQSLKASGKFLLNPLGSLSKYVVRSKDEWNRTPLGHRIAMILKPIVTAANIAGLVLGIATGGSTSLATLITSKILAESASIAYAASMSSGLTTFLVYKVLKWPLDQLCAAATDSGVKIYLNNGPLQKLFHMLDDEDMVQGARFNLDMEVENIMNSGQVVGMIHQLEQNSEEGIEEEVRRYVEGLIMEGFVDEMVPVIQEAISRKQELANPNFGWLDYTAWHKYRENDNAKALQFLRLKGPGINGVSAVMNIKKSMFKKKKRLTLVQESETPGDWMDIDTYDVDLDEELKQQVWVEDIVAYKRLYSGWLLWHDWTDYRKGWNGRALKGKMIYIDATLQGCGYTSFAASSCLNSMPTFPSADARTRVTVTETEIKYFGSGFRYIYTDKVCSGGFQLTPHVKGCLRIHDPRAFQKYMEDAPRRAAEEAWLTRAPENDVRDDAFKVINGYRLSKPDPTQIFENYRFVPNDSDSHSLEAEVIFEEIPVQTPKNAKMEMPGWSDDYDEWYRTISRNRTVKDVVPETITELTTVVACAMQEGLSPSASADAGNEFLQRQLGTSSVGLQIPDSLGLLHASRNSSASSLGEDGEDLSSDDLEVLAQANDGFRQASAKVQCDHSIFFLR